MVKPGYKQTEIGTLPEDWKLATLEDLYSITSSKRVFQSEWRDSGIPFYRAREIAVMGEGLPAPKDLYISEEMYERYSKQYGSIKENDVLITGVGTLGKVYVVKKDDKFYFKDGNIIWLQWNGQYSSQFLKHLYRTTALTDQVFGNAGGSTVPTYTITNAKATLVPCPDYLEQCEIAEVLSEIDNLIATSEKQISKKKAIKQGAMQELLTGKKRLPGFSGEITYQPLRSLCTVFSDGDWIESKDQSSDGIRLIQTGNVGNGRYIDKQEKQRFISVDTFNRLNCLEIFEGDVLVSRLPDPAGRACILPPSNKCRITAVDCTVVRFSSYNPVLFVAYSQTKLYQEKVEMAMAGSTRQRISRKELGEIPIPVFPTIEEQNTVASIFANMDAEIEALEQKLAKYRQVKQGMMQQLLTGKIRLV